MKYKKKFFYLILFLIVIPIQLWAETKPKPTFAFLEPHFYVSSLEDFGKISASPLQWAQSDWQVAGLVLGAGIIAYSQDQSIKNWVQNQDSSVLNAMGKTGAVLGHPALLLLGTGVGYSVGYFYDNERLKKVSLTGCESILISQGIVETIKMLAKRSRPRTQDAYNTWNGFNSDGKLIEDDRESFPSAHSAATFALATLIADEYSDISWIPWTSYGLATAIAGSRVLANDHWLSDVIIGSAIGFFTTKGLTFLQRENKITLIPQISDESLAMSLQIKI